MSSSEKTKNEARSALLLEVIPRMMRIIRTEMRQLGKQKLTVPQFRVLLQLSQQPMSNQELASWMGVSAPTMSKMIDNMVKRNLITRKTEAADRRQILVTNTKKGRTLVQATRGIVQQRFTEKISLIPEDKLKAIETGLSIMKETFL
ncbi:MAG: MarR family transcriptional regulator [Deltaproteobacteria bacterium]|nr:MarR family transcriptional regulator [Deltaproteobacteria bacterium]